MRCKVLRKCIAPSIIAVILALLLFPALWLPLNYFDLTKPTITERATVDGIDPKYGIYFITETGYEIQTFYQPPPHRVRGGETGELTYRGSIPLHFTFDDPIPLYFTNDGPSRSMSLVYRDFLDVLILTIVYAPAILLLLLLSWCVYILRRRIKDAKMISHTLTD